VGATGATEATTGGHVAGAGRGADASGQDPGGRSDGWAATGGNPKPGAEYTVERPDIRSSGGDQGIAGITGVAGISGTTETTGISGMTGAGGATGICGSAGIVASGVTSGVTSEVTSDDFETTAGQAGVAGLGVVPKVAAIADSTYRWSIPALAAMSASAASQLDDAGATVRGSEVAGAAGAAGVWVAGVAGVADAPWITGHCTAGNLKADESATPKS